MRLLVLSVLIYTAVAGHAQGGNDSKVLELTEENYDEVINSTPLLLVEFYAPW